MERKFTRAPAAAAALRIADLQADLR